MPSITLGRKRPSEAIVENGVKPKKLKFTDDGAAIAVASAPTQSSSRVKPDYGKLTKKMSNVDKTSPERAKKTSDTTGKASGSSILVQDEIDFPRGGGSSYTPFEHKKLREEAIREADSQIFKESTSSLKKNKKRSRDGKSKSGDLDEEDLQNKDSLRIQHLSYKKLLPGTRILGQVIAILPFSIVLSLPHQMVGHVPVDKVSHIVNKAMDELGDDGSENDADEEENSTSDEEEKISRIATLEDMFTIGQYVLAVVTAVHPQGVVFTPASGASVDLGKPQNELDRASRRLELSLLPQQFNAGLSGKDLIKGQVLPAVITSVEDYGYTLDFAIANISGFLPFQHADQDDNSQEVPHNMKIGTWLATTVLKMEDNGRVCNVGIGSKVPKAELSTLPSASAVHPGCLVKAMITESAPEGLNVQVLGLFSGTIHPLHMSPGAASTAIGKKIKARILWDIPGTEPTQFALSTLPHILSLRPRLLTSPNDGEESQDLQAVFPIGTILDAVKVARVDTDRSLFLQVTEGLLGTVHISDVADEHVASLPDSSGPYKVGTVQRARVIGHNPLDGTLRCSMKESVLSQKWLKADDIQVGSLVKGTVISLNEKGLFVSLSGNVHAIVWPNHYADIPLKHPERKFRVGKLIKCRVLVVDPAQNRITLTAKKTLMESTLPIISAIETNLVNAVTHAIVFKISERVLTVEFYNNVRGIIPYKEALETLGQNLDQAFKIGQVVKVRIIEVKLEAGILVASIIKANSPVGPSKQDILAMTEIGQSVSGTVSDIHKEHVAITLQPSGALALLTLNNLANARDTSIAQLRSSLKIGDDLRDLVIVSKNSEKGLVIVVVKPKDNSKNMFNLNDPNLKLENLQLGQRVTGVVLKHSKKGAVIKMSKRLYGCLHLTEISDDYSTHPKLPPIDSVVTAAVANVDKTHRLLDLSIRPSLLEPQTQSSIVDPRIRSFAELRIGQKVRGFVTEVVDFGVFVALSPSLDAKIPVKHLFDVYNKDWKGSFTPDQMVEGRILRINVDKNQAEMTLRSGEITSLATNVTLSDFSKGQRVDGVIQNIAEYGVFIQIKGSDIKGLCHRSELADPNGPSADEMLKTFKKGDVVRALIISVDAEKKRLGFSLKPSHFFDEELEDVEMASGGENQDQNSDDGSEIVMNGQEPDEEDSGDEQEQDTDGHSEITREPENEMGAPAINLAAPLRWTVANDAEEDETEISSDEDDGGPARKKRKRKHEILQDLTLDLQSRAPQSTADFERLLLASPNSSYLWLQFMAFQLQLSDIEKAREVGRRALKAINFREEQERLNVWIGLLNLEVTYGTEATLDAIFKEAARANDSKTVHWRLALLLDDAQKPEQAEEQFRKSCKKFGSSCKVWTLFAEHYFKRGMPEKARELLSKSLLSLEKRKHLKVASKFAQLEYRMGDPERGRTLFEGIVDTHRKRLDLWNIYIDMETGQRDIHRIRNICERAITLKLSKKKAKFLFKKWLELEKRLGDKEGEALVKVKAVEWTQSSTQSAPE